MEEDKINSIVVDDESGCIDNLIYHLKEFCPRIHVVATAHDIESTISALARKKIDLAFLDIHLFDQNVFDLLNQSVQQEIATVFVTAYEQYAINAFRISAVDYLLKPLDETEVIACYNKVLKHFELQHLYRDSHGRQNIILKQGDQVYVSHLDNIIYLQANGFYTHVYFEHEKRIREVLVSKPISVLQEEWKSNNLIRIHKSYIINRRKIDAIKRIGNIINVIIGDFLIPVAKRRVSDLYDHL